MDVGKRSPSETHLESPMNWNTSWMRLYKKRRESQSFLKNPCPLVHYIDDPASVVVDRKREKWDVQYGRSESWRESRQRKIRCTIACAGRSTLLPCRFIHTLVSSIHSMREEGDERDIGGGLGTLDILERPGFVSFRDELEAEDTILGKVHVTLCETSHDTLRANVSARGSGGGREGRTGSLLCIFSPAK